MFETFSRKTLHALCDRVAERDAELRAILRTHGYPPLWTRPNTFETLVHIILEQQVSLASAKAALEKLRERIESITPERVLALTDDDLRACYFSRQKTGYVRALATELQTGALDLARLKKLPDDRVRARLIALKGIGHWTIDIYLIFVLHRTDIFPSGDLAAVNALRRVKRLPAGTSRNALLVLTAAWSPYRTLATMLLWHDYLSTPAKLRRV
ncbi:MAG: DNA-3-methyladenine glycosylase 2 family protein [Pirellulales bacterium]